MLYQANRSLPLQIMGIGMHVGCSKTWMFVPMIKDGMDTMEFVYDTNMYSRYVCSDDHSLPVVESISQRSSYVYIYIYIYIYSCNAGGSLSVLFNN